MRHSNPTLRTFAWEDLDGLARLVRRLERNAHRSVADTAEWTRRLYRRPGSSPQRDCLLASDGPRLTGYLFMVAEEPIGRGVLRGGVHPGHRGRGTGRLLLDAMAAHARELRFDVLHAEVPPGAKAAQGLLKAAGFSRVRTHWHMLCRAAGPVGLKTPAGHALRVMAPEEAEALTQLQNDAFAGTWGFSPNTVEQLRYDLYQMPGWKADEVLLLERDGLLAGYSWTHREAPDGPGVINMVGVDPRYRGLGLGRAVTAASIDYLIARGAPSVALTVDRENTAAVRLYRRLGFRVRRATHWYERRLQ